MFKKILIANRGEIACRVAATARKMGIRTVAVYSDVDATARHVELCDEAVAIGAASPKESYLRGDRIIAAALATGAEAVHPGYGFLSENEEFAQACADAGLVFIGPPASAIKAMGLKAEAKQLMERAGVPLVPGYHGAAQGAQLLRREADRIGYPVLIKASAGGGGKGMRIVTQAADFDAALASCQREASSSFGDDAVLIERYVTRPRHIEIQVFGDCFGDCIYLFERDCSVQRRHQKVLEEAPAPGISEARRAEMGAAAVAAAKAVGYVGAGTVEFIAEPVEGGREGQGGDLRFFFMEMNTRLQVEHPVTEAVTGLDLVEWQLRIAAGERLPLRQAEVRRHGHAIEARICAENPDAGFLPATGRLDVYRTPPGSMHFERGNVRVDAGVREGDSVLPYYDSMIAKLIVWGRDRAEALSRMEAALGRTQIVGLQTNVAFLRRVVASRSFAEADLDTALIERERAVLFDAAPLPLQVAAAGMVARLLDAEQALQTPDPWSRRDGWRLHGVATRQFETVSPADKTQYPIRLERSRDGRRTLAFADGQRLAFESRPLGADRFDVTLAGRRWTLDVHVGAVPGTGTKASERFTVFAADASAVIDRLAGSALPAGDSGAEGGRLTAPMPGKLIAFLAAAGEAVTKGQPLAVMEAMKMEHTISAPRDGTIDELLYAVGDQVAEGGELLRLVMA